MDTLFVESGKIGVLSKIIDRMEHLKNILLTDDAKDEDVENLKAKNKRVWRWTEFLSLHETVECPD